MKHGILKLFSFLLILALSYGCSDDLIFDPSYAGEGQATISANVTFKPLVPGIVSRAEGGTPGNAIKDMDNINVIFYTPAGEFVKRVKVENPVISENKETSSDAIGSNEHQAESETKKATFQLKEIPYGNYQIYAVANVPEETLAKIDDQPLSALKSINLNWNLENVPANNQMFGYFSPDNKSAGFDAPTIEISKPAVSLHAWVKRAASKVTVAFDGSGLKDGVEIFIRSVTIKDIPQTCYLGKYNPYDPFDTENKTPDSEVALYRNSEQVISYCPEGVKPTDDIPLTAYNKDWPGYVSKSHPINGYNYKEVMEDPNLTTDEARIKAMHGENVNALYFYENMQGKGEDGTPTDKRQQVNDEHKNSGVVSYPSGVDPSDIAWKDAKKYGSYIEVKAYYNSNNSTEKQGEITYRFMLGKDTHLDYNAERNYHYKLTLMFKGWANDVDWHIDYKKDPTPLRYPRPFYISYLYNHSAMIPIEFDAPEDVTIKRITADIVQNNWYPTDCKYPVNLTLNTNSLSSIRNSQPSSWWYGAFARYVNTGILDNQPWNGFLSLRRPANALVVPEPTDLAHSTPSVFNKDHYDKNNLGHREYTEDEAAISSYPLYEAMDKDKLHVSWDNGTYYVKVPIWTRARQMITRTAYTGNNPYNAFYRDAKVNIVIELSDGRKLDSSDLNLVQQDKDKQNIQVRQVRRLVNPKGIYRSANNDASFNVKLKVLESEDATEFKDLKSDGPWRAYVIRQSEENFISLKGAPGTSTADYTFQYANEVMTRQSVEGASNTFMDFDVIFNGTASKPRYAIIRVEYNYCSCYHLIFVRQGYEADDTFGDGRVWCTGNAIDQNNVAQNPLDEGSLFRFGNWTGIASESNVNSKSPWRLVQPNDFEGNAGTNLTLTDGTKGAKWSDVKSFNPQGGTFPARGDGYRVATYDDFMSFKPKAGVADTDWHIQTGFGVCYGDGATGTASSIGDVFGHKGEAGDVKGMRGCFVYDTRTGGNLFFPMGSSGYGHRKHSLSRTYQGVAKSFSGVLRYSCATRWGYFDAVTTNENKTEAAGIYKYGVFDAPLFWDIFRSDGAIYWFNTMVNLIPAWDINYSTYDFNTIEYANIVVQVGGQPSSTTDACFVRCIAN